MHKTEPAEIFMYYKIHWGWLTPKNTPQQVFRGCILQIGQNSWGLVHPPTEHSNLWRLHSSVILSSQTTQKWLALNSHGLLNYKSRVCICYVWGTLGQDWIGMQLVFIQGIIYDTGLQTAREEGETWNSLRWKGRCMFEKQQDQQWHTAHGGILTQLKVKCLKLKQKIIVFLLP